MYVAICDFVTDLTVDTKKVKVEDTIDGKTSDISLENQPFSIL